ncbi:MAG: protein TolQ [Alphaproteobacteria bacterium]|nr:protein TolQ [Alphaproteobacteria bacterium]
MTLRRGVAAFLPALVVLFAMSLAAPALAQSAPRAAPTGEPAQTAPLEAPTANSDVSADSGGMAASPIGGVSIVSLFMRADPLVKTVMIVLLLASIWSWAIIINKGIALSSLRRRAGKFEKVFWSGQSLDELFSQFASRNDHPFAAVFVSGVREWRRAFDHGAPKESAVSGVKDRVEKAMSVTISREADAIEGQLGFLATVASTAPFVGLFGTVWGIMNSFSAIAARHDTTLAVVAPGIAEALFATAMGLLAAIPAAIFYNRYVNEIGRYTNRLDAFADELSAILSRQLDEKAR